jgi:hypothetical protein
MSDELTKVQRWGIESYALELLVQVIPTITFITFDPECMRHIKA